MTPELLREPVFFEPNRVWRCYRGGRLLDAFHGNPAGRDGHFPEEWLASLTRADNGPWQQTPDEGLSHIRGRHERFVDVLTRYPTEALGATADGDGLGVLCKFLDSAIRLPIQCHPDRAFARTHYGSAFGKTEAWVILATREIDGEKPYLLFGFKPEVTAERFRQAVWNQNISAMCDCLHRVEPAPGDIYFIPGRMPHAIGPGLMLLEVQEPTDLVIQPERRIGDVTLDDRGMWGALDPETALTCFDDHGAPLPDLLARYQLRPEVVTDEASGRVERLIGPTHTDCFQVDRLTLRKAFSFCHQAPWHIAIITDGCGRLRTTTGTEYPLQRGETFFVSHQIDRTDYVPDSSSRLEVHVVSRSDGP